MVVTYALQMGVSPLGKELDPNSSCPVNLFSFSGQTSDISSLILAASLLVALLFTVFIWQHL
jgi:hypothetical protein